MLDAARGIILPSPEAEMVIRASRRIAAHARGDLLDRLSEARAGLVRPRLEAVVTHARGVAPERSKPQLTEVTTGRDEAARLACRDAARLAPHLAAIGDDGEAPRWQRKAAKAHGARAARP